MSIVSLDRVREIFGGSELSPEQQDQLAKEVMLMTLARATAADTNIKAIEITKVAEVLKKHTGEDIPEKEIRILAQSELWQKAPLEKYLASSAKKMRSEDCLEIAQALEEVINVDGRVSEWELSFFDNVSNALGLTPSQLMGMKPEEG